MTKAWSSYDHGVVMQTIHHNRGAAFLLPNGIINHRIITNSTNK